VNTIHRALLTIAIAFTLGGLAERARSQTAVATPAASSASNSASDAPSATSEPSPDDTYLTRLEAARAAIDAAGAFADAKAANDEFVKILDEKKNGGAVTATDRYKKLAGERRGALLYATVRIGAVVTCTAATTVRRAMTADEIQRIRAEGFAGYDKAQAAAREIVAIESGNKEGLGFAEQLRGPNKSMQMATDCFYSLRGDSVARERATTSLCSGFNELGDYRYVCVAVGLFSSTISQVYFLGQNPRGIAWGRLVSVGVPYASLRVLPSILVPWLAIDLGAYSALYTSTASTGSDSTTTSGGACSTRGTAFETQLPCVGNPTIRPIVGVQAGLTFGRSNIGYLTVAPIGIGWASVGNSARLEPYFAMTLGTLQLTGSF
jgi:hypothetical protein